jgi:osmotically-inducible protein OsmY
LEQAAPIVQARRFGYAGVMRTAAKIAFSGLSLLLSLGSSGLAAQAAEQSRLPADQAVQQNVSRALIQAGIDPRLTSVQVVTTADHVLYLSGLISNRDTIKLAGSVAAKTAPSWRVVNNIRGSFFDDPNHVRADKTK